MENVPINGSKRVFYEALHQVMKGKIESGLNHPGSRRNYRVVGEDADDRLSRQMTPVRIIELGGNSYAFVRRLNEIEAYGAKSFPPHFLMSDEVNLRQFAILGILRLGSDDVLEVGWDLQRNGNNILPKALIKDVTHMAQTHGLELRQGTFYGVRAHTD